MIKYVSDWFKYLKIGPIGQIYLLGLFCISVAAHSWHNGFLIFGIGIMLYSFIRMLGD